jgi:hypothetical protein
MSVKMRRRARGALGVGVILLMLSTLVLDDD